MEETRRKNITSHQPSTNHYGHHNIPPHSHAHGQCPLNGDSFAWCPKQDGDCRSSCPALNTLANHGYINRDGKHIEPSVLTKAVSKVYGCSTLLSLALVYGGRFLLGQYRSISLEDISRHNLIEHNASLTKGDAGEDEYGPDEVNSPLLTRLLKDSRSRTYLDCDDLSLARIRRESSDTHHIDHLHQKIARGEMALILNVFGTSGPGSNNKHIPLDIAGTWFRDERLPDGWKPLRIVGIPDLLRDISLIRSTMRRMRKHWDVFGKFATYLETSSDKSPLSLDEFKDRESTIRQGDPKVLGSVLTTSPSHLSTFGTIEPPPPAASRSDTSFSIASSITLVNEHNHEDKRGESILKINTPDSETHTFNKLELFQELTTTTVTVSSLYAHS